MVEAIAKLKKKVSPWSPLPAFAGTGPAGINSIGGPEVLEKTGFPPSRE
jgi:hypothetical protein